MPLQQVGVTGMTAGSVRVTAPVRAQWRRANQYCELPHSTCAELPTDLSPRFVLRLTQLSFVPRGERSIRTGISCLALLLTIAERAHAQAPHATATPASSFEVPAWAFPQAAPGTRTVLTDTVAPLQVPNSDSAFTLSRIRDYFNAIDWHPETHRAAPDVVLHGRKPAMFACGICHLPDGNGRPENATIAGLPRDYIIRQVRDMHARTRGSAFSPNRPAEAMRLVADSVTDDELREAAKYFSHAKNRPQFHVIESDSVPRTIPLNGLYSRAPGTEMEALNGRLIEIADDIRRHEMRDSRAEYTAYVPRGSLARGKAIAQGDVRGIKGCQSCHGGSLGGRFQVPPISGRPSSYLLRQLLAFKTGARASKEGQPMREEAATLSLDDMIAVAAYATSLKP